MSDYIDHIASPGRDCAIVAHRGAWHQAPENSLQAIENAIAGGFDIVEVDVRVSADDELFLMHDDTLERMAGDPAVAESRTIAELTGTRLRNADGGKNALTTDQVVPTLRQALEVARGRIFVDLDLKDLDLFPRVAAEVAAMGMSGQVDLKARVDSQPARDWIRDIDLKGIPFMAMARFDGEDADELTEILEAMAPFMCETKFDALATIEARRQRFAAAGIAIWVNTLDPVSCCDLTDTAALADPEAIWGRLIDAGVSVIQTDEPEALKTYLGGRSR